jgi:hypothetical protein
VEAVRVVVATADYYDGALLHSDKSSCQQLSERLPGFGCILALRSPPATGEPRDEFGVPRRRPPGWGSEKNWQPNGGLPLPIAVHTLTHQIRASAVGRPAGSAIAPDRPYGWRIAMRDPAVTRSPPTTPVRWTSLLNMAVLLTRWPDSRQRKPPNTATNLHPQAYRGWRRSGGVSPPAALTAPPTGPRPRPGKEAPAQAALGAATICGRVTDWAARAGVPLPGQGGDGTRRRKQRGRQDGRNSTTSTQHAAEIHAVAGDRSGPKDSHRGMSGPAHQEMSVDPGKLLQAIEVEVVDEA